MESQRVVGMERARECMPNEANQPNMARLPGDCRNRMPGWAAGEGLRGLASGRRSLWKQALLGEDELVVAREAQMVFVALVLDDELPRAVEQPGAFDTTGNGGGSGAQRDDLVTGAVVGQGKRSHQHGLAPVEGSALMITILIYTSRGITPRRACLPGCLPGLPGPGSRLCRRGRGRGRGHRREDRGRRASAGGALR